MALEMDIESAYRNGSRESQQGGRVPAESRSVRLAEVWRRDGAPPAAAAKAPCEKAPDSMPSSPSGYVQVLKRQGFAWLLAAQALAVFDDQTFKQLLILYIAARPDVSLSQRNLLMSMGMALFVLPYIVFSSYAGQVADRYSKRRVIILLKTLEASLFILATMEMFFGHIYAMFVLLFLLGIHSTFLDPAKEGILPQIFRDEALPKANGAMQLTIYTMIVAGPVAAGILLDAFARRPYIPVAMLVASAMVGFFFALGITRVGPSGYRERFHWNAPGEFWRDFAEIRASRSLLLAVLGIAYFWFLGSMFLLNVVDYGRDLLHLSNTGISELNAAISIGIGLGAFLAGKLSGDNVELGLVPIGSVGLGVFSMALYFTHHSFALTLAGFFLLGLAGGIFIVPLQAFLQARAGEQSKGRVIAASNVLTFTGVALGAGVFWLLSTPLHLQPYQGIVVMGAVSIAVTVYILTVLPDFMVRLVLWTLTHTFYRLRVDGGEHLPRRGPAVLVCNHISFADPLLIGACTDRFIRFLIYRRFYESRGIHWLAKLMGAIPVAENDPPRRIVESLNQARERLRAGELVCVFAEGSITRTGNLLRFRRGFERLTRGMDVPVIPVHLDRVWGSIFSYEGGRFFFKWPHRIPFPVTVTFGAPLPAGASAFQTRQAVMKLGAEAFAHRDDAQRPLPQLFLETVRRNWRRPAMADSSQRRLTFGRALVGAILFRRLIRRRCRDERMVGVLLPPSVPTALLNLGISLAGRVPVNLNYSAPAEATRAAVGRCGIKTIFTSQQLLKRLALPRTPDMVMIEDAAQGMTRGAKLLALLGARLLPAPLLRRWLLPRGVELDSLATVIFSSGSTGAPKGVMLSHRNIVSNLEGIGQAIHVDERDCLLGVLPFFHSFGYTVGLWLPVVTGCRVVYHSNPLESRKVGELCRTYGVTLLIATPTFVWDYVRRAAPKDFASLRLAIVGAEKMKPELAQVFREKFGKELCEGYGCTELSPVVSVGAPGYFEAGEKQPGSKPGSVGHPIPGVAARIVDPQTFEDLGAEREGLLLVKGASVMLGYLDEPERTRQVVRDGWYVTGDIAKLDEDGFITITDRLSRFSKIAGEMVPHIRVEDALHEAMGTAERKFAVTSVADSQKGEKLIVLHTELGLSVDELLRRLREAHLPALWVPRRENFFQIDALPMLGSGKTDWARLKSTARQLTGNAAAPEKSQP